MLLHLRRRKRITRREFVTSVKNRLALYALARRSSVGASRAICHYTCHPAGEIDGQKPRPSWGGDLSCPRQRAMKEASLFIGSTDHASHGCCVLNVYGERSSTFLGESSAKYNIISFRLRKHAYASGLTRARFVTSVLRSDRYAFSLSFASGRLSRASKQRRVVRSESFQRYHRELERYFKIR